MTSCFSWTFFRWHSCVHLQTEQAWLWCSVIRVFAWRRLRSRNTRRLRFVLQRHLRVSFKHNNPRQHPHDCILLLSVFQGRAVHCHQRRVSFSAGAQVSSCLWRRDVRHQLGEEQQDAIGSVSLLPAFKIRQSIIYETSCFGRRKWTQLGRDGRR